MTDNAPRRTDAPAAVAVVRDFVNTTDLETGADDLGTAAALGRHLHSAGLCTSVPRTASEDLQEAHALRTGLRRALELNHVAGSAELPQLRAALRRLAIGLDWGPTGTELRATAGGARGGLARIGLAAHRCVADGTWTRLKVCAFDECGWAYFDHSKNRSRNWCEYGCGNKVKTRTYRARRRAR